jgi:hypothetical protein
LDPSVVTESQTLSVQLLCLPELWRHVLQLLDKTFSTLRNVFGTDVWATAEGKIQEEEFSNFNVQNC